MTARPQLGVLFLPQRPIGDLPEAAAHAERLGFDQLWVVEDCFLSGGLTATAAALAATSRLRVGVGLLPVSVRNPAIVAMELATLAELYPHRVRAAFGHGVEAWMRQIGARPPDRLVALREVVGAVRALLNGETVDSSGRFVQLCGVRLDHPPAHPPDVLVGTNGERSIGVARAVADGVLLPEGSSGAAVAWCADLLAGHGTITTYAWLSIDEDVAAARSRMVPVIRDWSLMGLYPNLMAHGRAGPDDDIETAVERVAVAGAPRDCARALARLSAAGASSIILAPVGPDPTGQLERFADEALPHIVADAAT